MEGFDAFTHTIKLLGPNVIINQKAGKRVKKMMKGVAFKDLYFFFANPTESLLETNFATTREIFGARKNMFLPNILRKNSYFYTP